jgi:hypothetical protein
MPLVICLHCIVANGTYSRVFPWQPAVIVAVPVPALGSAVQAWQLHTVGCTASALVCMLLFWPAGLKYHPPNKGP